MVALALGILVPFIGMFVLRARERADSERAAAGQRVLELALVMAVAVDEHVTHVQTLLAASAHTVRPSAGAAYNDSVLVAILAGLEDSVANSLWLVAPDGKVIGTSVGPRPDVAALSVADRHYFQEALRTRRPVVGEPTLSRPTSVWSLVFAHPILDAHGEISAVALASVRLRSLSHTLGALALPPATLVTLIDSSGTVLGRTVGADEWVGRNISRAGVVSGTITDRRGIIEVPGLDGVVRVNGYASTTNVPWRVVVGTPREVAFATATSALRRDLLLTFLTAALAIFVATALARRLTRPLDALTANARAIAGGEHARRVPVVGSASELSTLAENFNTMAATVAARTAELHDSERRYRMLFDISPLPMFVFELDNLQILAVNQAAMGLYGYSREEFLQMRITELRPSAEQLRLHLALRALNEMQHPEGTPISTGIWLHQCRDGSMMEVEIFTVMVNYEGRRARLSTILDLTSRRSAERALADSQEQLRRAQKMEALGRFAGGIAHDFNNLLTGILGYCDLAIDEMDPATEARTDVMAARATAERAAVLTRQILAFSRKQVLQPVPLELNVVVSEMVGILTRIMNGLVSVELVLAPELGFVLADRSQIEQVVVNLAVNARDAMPDGGVVRIATTELLVDQFGDVIDGTPPEGFGSRSIGPALAAGPWVCLSVHDSGMGMSASIQSQILEPFFTTKERGKGTGLGLPTVDGIVQQSGGVLRVTSSPGEGSAFHVYLPRVAPSGIAPSPAAEGGGVVNDPSARSSGVILLAEDEDTVRAVAAAALRRQGYDVLTARDGAEAISIAEDHGAPLDLLITDVVMPRMSGPELAEQLRGSQPGLRVLFTSGFTEDVHLLHDLDSDELTFLAKPFTPQQLVECVRIVLVAHDEGREAPCR